ncbi:hypothetical protein P3S72_20685 [Pseudomonas sp. D3]|uniref:hypothetical protein n=1 Tax=Pseudomonas sp. D3 TaxID=517398 RepID=UPI0023E3B6D6|nr:hypothetical protein [Pseudomonas sp. D3]WET08901.1 hypothetical protein P3S72_20685 [Pseudomonas sp. D3]
MQATDRITLVLRAKEGDTLEQVMPFVQLGAPVSIGRGLAVIAGASDEDLQMVLGQERDDRQTQAQLQQEALGAPAHLAAHAQEMFDLLVRINTKCGGLDAALGHGIEPSEQMWTESREAMEAIWDLLDKVKSAEVFGSSSLIAENPATTDSMHIDDRVRMAANAKRYEWLRERSCIEDADNDIMVVRGDQYFDGDELDREIDNALRLARLEELHPCAD